MMRTIKLLSLSLALSCLPAMAADAQWDAFWVKFKQAVQRNDKNAIASMTKFPYVIWGTPMSKEEFLKKEAARIFTAKTRACIPKQKPVKDQDSYFVFCGEEIFIFAKDKGQWLFTEIGAND